MRFIARGRWWFIVAILASVTGITVWFATRPRERIEEVTEPSDLPPDPRLSYSGPLKNVHPSVPYVGDDKCAECHLDVSLTYSDHPMGRSLVPIGELASLQRYDKAVNNPFDAKGVRLWVDRQADRVFHRHVRIDDGKPVWEKSNEVHFAVGSGTRGFSYFTEMDGFVFQTPISWYTQKQIWDLSPGYQDVTWPGRAVPTGCMQCHANAVKQVPGVVDQFQPGVFNGHAIGCERCHGPGQVHVEARERNYNVEGGPDGSIANPARMPWKLRENVCEQCHLGGVIRVLRRGRHWDDFRPGMPLDDFMLIFVANPELPGTHRAVGQVEQMHRSQCFQKSPDEKKMGCLSCHDPHQRVEKEHTVAHYRARCLTCHQQKGCTLSKEKRLVKQPDDSCIACHMPRAQTADVAHVALTNHAIPRDPSKETHRPAAPGTLPFVPFHDLPLGPRIDERRRDLSVLLIRLATQGQLPPSILQSALSESEKILASRLRIAPTDPEGWVALGQARLMQQRFEDALDALRTALVQEPKNYRTLALMASIELDRGRPEISIDLWTKAAEINPYVAAYRRSLTQLHQRRSEWPLVEKQSRAWINLEPNNVEARQSLVRSLLEQGKSDEARRAFVELRTLKPHNLEELEVWYRSSTR